MFADEHQIRVMPKSDLELEIVALVLLDADGVGLSQLQVFDDDVQMATAQAIGPRIFVEQFDGDVLFLRLDFRSDGVNAATEWRICSADFQLRVVNGSNVNRVIQFIVAMENDVVASRNEEAGNLGLSSLFLVASLQSEESDDEKRRQGDDGFD